MGKGSATSALYLLLILAVAAASYLPGLTGGFAFDDYTSILTNPAVSAADLSAEGIASAAWSGNAGPLKRPLASISFTMNYAFTGKSPRAFKFTNLAIHLANGLLVFWFCHLVLTTGVRPIAAGTIARNTAFFAASLWLVHPLNLTSVLYVVQRMTSLSALFTLAALIAYCSGRAAQLRKSGGNVRLYLLVPLCAVLALLSKENAALLAFYCATLETVLFRFTAADPGDRRNLRIAYAAFLVVPLAIGGVYLFTHLAWIESWYALRRFDLGERLFTEARVLWWYLRMILAPRLSELGLYHDDVAVSTGWLHPPGTIAAITGLFVAMAVALGARLRYPLLSFAIFWFLSGHLLESSFIPLELVYEHRNYLPAVGVLLAVAHGVYSMIGRIKAGLAMVIASAYVLVLALMTSVRAADWSDPLTLAAMEAEHHPMSHRAVYDLGRSQYGMFQMTKDRRFLDLARANLEHSAEFDPDTKRPYFGLVRVAYENGLQPENRWIEVLLQRLRTGVMHPADTRDFQLMVRCFAEPKCPYPAELVFRIFEAALANDSMRAVRKAEVLASLAAFYVNGLKDLDAAVVVLSDAVQLDPDLFGYRRMLLQILRMAERYDEIAAEIESIKSRPRWRDQPYGANGPDATVAEYSAVIGTPRPGNQAGIDWP